MEIAILSIPFITALVLLLFFRKETVWWEYVILLAPSILMYFLIRFVIVSAETSSTEYLGAYASKIYHYDEWDEWIHRTCTRQVYAGTDSKGHAKYRTETYDCSYREYHPERWEIEDNNGATFPISETEYKNLVKLWQTPQHFIDMHRDYFRIDGDAQYYEWNKQKETIRDITYPKTYKNKIKVSKSIFNFEEISKKEASGYGLYEYPSVSENYRQNSIIGYKLNDKKAVNEFNYINSVFGEKYQFRTFLLFYYNKDILVSEKQRSYWVGGNKNEFIICIGLDSITNKIQWVNCFSWMDEPRLEVYTEQYINDQDSLDITDLGLFLEKQIPSEWKRKEFKDFDYLKIELTTGQYIGILIFILLYNIGISIFIIKNDFKN